ncbi:hypothetical protein ACS0TY_006766 [Phlomoides rotata]
MVRSTEEIISKHIIKPSSPTPKSLKTQQISFLDQIGPPLYIPLVFFYEAKPNVDHAKISESLKQSLSQALSHFYPLAGRLEENSFVDCDDSGVEFIEARVHAPLSHFTKSEELRQLIPVDSTDHTTLSTLVLVKLSFFECGGFSVGVCCSHKIGDYASYAEFMNAWATLCRGEPLVSLPSFDLALRLPPKPSVMVHHTGEKEEFATKRLVFDAKLLQKIKAKCVCDEVKNPTRVEALSAFIWKMFIDATKLKRGPERSSFAAFHAVDLRPRAVPPFPDQTFGNCYVGQFAFTSGNGMMGDLVPSLRAAIRSVDADYIKNVVSGDDYLRIVDEANESFKRGTTDLCCFSSWWRFPVYGVDFGWGKPCWVGTVAQPSQHLVLFMSTPEGDGIEAWVNMPLDFSDFIQTGYNHLLTT